MLFLLRPDWAPHGARRFLELAACGDLEDALLATVNSRVCSYAADVPVYEDPALAEASGGRISITRRCVFSIRFERKREWRSCSIAPTRYT